MPELDPIIESIFPIGVVATSADPRSDAEGLFPSESCAISGAAPKRIREFTVGRSCARSALALIGVSPGPILVGHAREPVWPKGVTGSISHCEDFCAAVAAPLGPIRSLGLDVETAQPLDNDIAEVVGSASEWNAARRVLGDYIAASNLLFSAKEAIFKACWPLTRTMFDFRDVHIELAARTKTFHATSVDNRRPLARNHQLYGRFDSDGVHVFAGAWTTS